MKRIAGLAFVMVLAACGDPKPVAAPLAPKGPSASSAVAVVNSLSVEQYDGRLRRLEHSVLRVERINLEILVMLQKLVAAVTKPNQGTEP